METFELRYFLVAAELQSVNKAADRLVISPPAISRAIKRLEDELGVKLFERIGRNISLSQYGKQLQKEVSRIIGDIDDLKTQFKPTDYHLGISIIGTEFSLSSFVPDIIKKLDSKRLQLSLDLKMGQTSKDIERSVLDGEAHLGLITKAPSSSFKKIKLGEYFSKTYVGEGHPLYKYAKKELSVDVHEVLKFEFASFFESVFNQESSAPSADGWRDDKFKRKIALKSESVEAVLKLVEAGRYLSYLPTALEKGRDFLPLITSGCPYKCETEVFLIADRKSNFGWLNSLF